MKNVQPNSEKVKALFYAYIVNSDKIDRWLLSETVAFCKVYDARYKRVESFKKELNSFLDNMDIRMVGSLIDILTSKCVKVPNWMKYKTYSIDYNENGMLDFIIHSKRCEC